MPVGSSRVQGRFDYPGDVDMFRFTPPVSGTLTADVSSSLANSVVLLNSDQVEIAVRSRLDTSLIGIGDPSGHHLEAGQTYYLQVSPTDGESVGDYVLTLGVRPDDFGSDVANALPLALSAMGPRTQAGHLDHPGDVDVFRFTAPVTGQMAVTHQANGDAGLSNVVGTVFDEGGAPVASDDPHYAGDAPSNLAGFHVMAGWTYYVKVGAGDSTSTGGYTLTLNTQPDDFGNSFGDAQPLALSATGPATQAGRIDYPGDVDVFQFTAPVTGQVAVIHQAGGDLGLDGVVTVFDAQKNPIVSDDPSLSYLGLANPSGFRVEAGQTYYVKVGAGDSTSTGGYTLTLATQPDDFGNSFSDAQPLALSATGPTAQAGRIDYPGDVDMFRFTAPITGEMTIGHQADGDPGFAGVVTVFDAGEKAIASDDPQNGDTSLGDPAGFHVVAGQTYYVEVGAGNPTDVGGYVLSFATKPDDFGDDFADAQPLSATFLTSGQSGTINYPGDDDMFRLDASGTGRLTVGLDATQASGLEGSLFVYDGKENLVASADAGPGGPGPHVTVDIVQGQTYYVEAGASSRATEGHETGNYVLSFTPQPGDEVEPNDMLATANPLSSGFPMQGTIAPNDVDYFRIDPTSDGLLVARVHAENSRTRLSLRDARGDLLVQSDGISPSNADDLIDQHVVAGTYYLEVQSLGGEGAYTLSYTLSPSSNPIVPGTGSYAGEPLLTADFNGDGIPDLIVANWQFGDGFSVLLGLGDGTFRNAGTYDQGKTLGPGETYLGSAAVVAVVAADFNGDGKLDLAVINPASIDVMVLLGNGDGTFRPSGQYAVGYSVPGMINTQDGSQFTGTEYDPHDLVVGDFNGDGIPDLAVANTQYGGGIRVLLGNGDGTFQPTTPFATGTGFTSLVAADFNHDGRTDLAAAGEAVTLFLGNGDGTFQQPRSFDVGYSSHTIVAADFNGDGKPDLAVDLDNSQGIVVLLSGKGDGTFQAPRTYAAGDANDDTSGVDETDNNPRALIARDVNGDGIPDLIAANVYDQGVALLIGNGDGTFQPQKHLLPGEGIVSIVAGDFDGDGRIDLAVPDPGLLVLRGNGDGTFQAESHLFSGMAPSSIVTGDFNNDGRTDMVVGNYDSSDVSVFLGQGDGMFQDPERFTVGDNVVAVAAADFNNDGRLDLAVVGPTNGVSILRGNGDGTFQAPLTVLVGHDFSAVVAGDFNGDGIPDLAVGDYDGGITVLLGKGDGTFRSAGRYEVPGVPSSLAVIDLNRDGHLDLAVAETPTYNENYEIVNPGGLSVLLGDGQGRFRLAWQSTDGPTTRVVAADFNQDGKPDLAVLYDLTAPGYNYNYTSIAVYPGLGNGTFGAPGRYPGGGSTGNFPTDLVAADFNGDGCPDLATVIDNGGGFLLLLNDGRGGFRAPLLYPGGDFPTALVAADFNGDGRPDLAAATDYSDEVVVKLGVGDGSLRDPGTLAAATHASPLLADIDQDGTPDVLVLDAAGAILWRRGVPGRPGEFEPPVTINPGAPSLDFAIVPTGLGPLVASVDAGADSVSLFADRGGRFVKLGSSLATGKLPAQILAGDVNGDGATDLIVRNAGDGTVSLFLGDGLGGFTGRPALPVGPGISDLALADVDHSGMLDLVVTDEITGDVRVLINRGQAVFDPASRYPAGAGPYALSVGPDGSTDLQSMQATAGVAAGRFTPGGPTDLVTINPGSNWFDVLAGLGAGRFANPVAFPTKTPAQVVRVADFNHDGVTDIALLSADKVSVYLGDGKGDFSRQPPTMPGPIPLA